MTSIDYALVIVLMSLTVTLIVIFSSGSLL